MFTVKQVWETWTRTLPILKGMMADDSKYSLNLLRPWSPPHPEHLVTVSGCTAALCHLRDEGMLPTALKQLVPSPMQSVQTPMVKVSLTPKPTASTTVYSGAVTNSPGGESFNCTLTLEQGLELYMLIFFFNKYCKRFLPYDFNISPLVYSIVSILYNKSIVGKLPPWPGSLIYRTSIEYISKASG